MQLEIENQTIDNPTRADIERVVPRGRPPEDWWLSLADDGEADDEIIVDALGEGFAISAFVNGEHLVSDGVIDDDALRDLLTRYLAGDPAWRQRATWKPYKPSIPTSAFGPAGASSGRWSFLAFVSLMSLIIVGNLGDILGLWKIPPFRFPDLPFTLSWPFPPPFDSTPARVAISIVGGLFLLITIAAIVKLWELRRAARWPTASGRITQSEMGFALVSTGPNSMPTNKPVAKIAYEFKVGAATHRGTRVDFAEITDEAEARAQVARYPAGKIVQVFYNPANPNDATLERHAPKGLALGLLAFGAILAGFAAFVVGLFDYGPALIGAALPNATPIVLIPALLVGLILLAVYRGLRRDAVAARQWKATIGEVTSSSLASFSRKNGTGYKPVVEYSYTVGGRRYASRQIRLNMESGGSRDYAERLRKPYPVGQQVKVFYDPADPNRAALDIRSGMIWLFGLFGALALVIAVLAAGVM